MNTKIKTNNKKSETGYYFKAVILSLAVTLVFTLLFAGLMTFFDIGKWWASVLSSVSGGAGGFFGGMMLSKKTDKKGMISGLICGGILCCIILVTTLIIHGENLTEASFIRYIIILLSSTIGGILGKSSHNKSLVK